MTSEVQTFIRRIASHQHLSREDASRLFQIIMSGGATPPQVAALLMGMRMNGETVEEITGAAITMRAKAKKFNVPEHLKPGLLDTCGTGGDAKGSYNISTAVAFVVAACGVPIAKHGNKAVSSQSGSADVLQALGVNLEAKTELFEQALAECGVTFLMAPQYHAAMRHVAATRQELGMRTIFNLLGPLSNPAGATRQLVGVYAKEWVEPLARVLANLGVTHAWVVHGLDGLDELTVTGPSYVAELKQGEIKCFEVTPEEAGLGIEEAQALVGKDAYYNAQALRAVLRGEPSAYRDAVLLNAAAALIVAERVGNLKDGVAMAKQAIESGKATEVLAQLAAITQKDI